MSKEIMWKFSMLVLLPFCASFNPSSLHFTPKLRHSSVSCAMSQSPVLSPSFSRRNCLQLLVISAPTLLFGVDAFAEKDVSEGGLPTGALEFSRFLLSQKQWDDIGKRVESGHAEMDEKEWQNVQGYLRKLYATGDDMVSLAKSFDKENQDKVSEIAKSFRKSVKAADKPAAKKDWEAFLVSHKEISGYIQDFMKVRAEKAAAKNDIPDEI